MDAYILKHKNEEIRMASRSGGAFTALSDYILSQNGVVYGCAMNDENKAIHKRAETERERNAFRGSKYVQSDLQETFKMAQADLRAGKTVLFTGVPCQVVGLLSFLSGTNTEKLYTASILCHGVTSPLILREFLHYQEEKYGDKVLSVDFRNKRKFGWDKHWETVGFKNKEVDSTVYASTFYSNFATRESCFKCPYKSLDIPGDITLCDAWGISKANPDFNDNKGVSLVLLQTDKGKKWFQTVSDDCEIQQVDIKKYMQGPFISPYKRPEMKDEFWKIFYEKSFWQAYKRYVKTPLRKRVIRKAKKILKF